MACCIRNLPTKNYQNLIIDFQVTVENVGYAFLGRSVVGIGLMLYCVMNCRLAVWMAESG